MIARDHDHRNAEAGHQFGEHFVEQTHPVGRRHGAVVDVARDQDGIRTQLRGDAYELAQDMSLVFQQRNAMIDATEMPVGGVKKAHGDDKQDERRRSFAYLALQVR